MFFVKIFLLLLITAITLTLGILLPEKIMVYGVRELSYYFVFILFFTWVFYVVSIFHGIFLSILQKHYPALITVVVVSILVFLISPPRYKILTDEADLMGISMMMFEEREVGVPVEGIFNEYGAPECKINSPKRPLLFPLLVSVVHTLIGYSANNGFVLNFLISVFILFFFYLLVLRFLPVLYGYIGLLLMVASPIYVFCISSSGFEPLNLLFTIFLFLLLEDVRRSKNNPRKIELLLLTASLLAQCRYESILFLVITVVALLWQKNNELKEISYYSMLLPFTLLPVLWQHVLHLKQPEINKIGPEVFHSAEFPFSIQNLLTNIDENIFVLLGLNSEYGFIPLLSLLAVGGMYIMMRKVIIKHPGDRIVPCVLYTISCAFILLFFVISSFYWGNFTIAVDMRLSLVFLPFLVGSAVWFLYFLQQKIKICSSSILVIFFVIHLLYYWPVGSKQRLLYDLELPYEYDHVLKFVEQNYPEQGNKIIITEHPNLYLIQRISSMRPVNNEKLHQFTLPESYFDHIIAVQKYNPKTGVVYKSSQIALSFKLKPLENFYLSPQSAVQISEINKSL